MLDYDIGTLHGKAVRELARESGLPEAQIGELYQSELQRLRKAARVTDFLPLLISRLVKDKLRRP